MSPEGIFALAGAAFIAISILLRFFMGGSQKRDRTSSQSPSVVIIDQARRRADEDLAADVEEVEDAARATDPLGELADRARRRRREQQRDS